MEFWDWTIIRLSEVRVTPRDLVEVVFILLFAKLIIRIVDRALLTRIFRRNKVDSGRQYAVKQLIRYVVYTFALLSSIQALGISLSILWAGSAALLVGVGLGLQQTFNDLFSGLVLLGEGTVEVDDILEVDGIIGRVVSIGLRTSKLVTRDRIDLIIPNSKLVTEKVTNWSHFESATRFSVNVGVAYGTDTELVQKILLEVGEEEKSILRNPGPDVIFRDFGESSLDFTFYFFCHEFWEIEKIKSNIRFKIDALFKEHNIQIPFPQRDVWMRKSE